MNAILVLSFLSATQISGQLLFVPSNAHAEKVKLQVPGLLFQKEDTVAVVIDEEGTVAGDIEAQLEDVQSRGLQGRNQDKLRQDVSPIVAFQSDTSKKAAAPLCLACTCRIGRTSCKDAGGIAYFSKGESAIGQATGVTCTSARPCAIEAPDTMSACDPVCKRRSATCDPQVTEASALRCTDNVDTSFCKTDCEFRASGEKVLCNQQAIAKGVMNDIPKDVCSIFTGRKRRDTGARERGFNNAGFLRNSFLGRFIPSPASTIQTPGSALLAYAPTGRCLPLALAVAPLCTKLD